MLQAKGYQKDDAEQKCVETVSPYALRGEVYRVWEESPDPSRSYRHRRSKCLTRNEEDRQTGQCGKEAVEAQYGQGGLSSVDAEQLEDRGEQEGIEWSYHSRRAGVCEKRRAKAMTRHYGSGDSAYFPAEVEVVPFRRELLLI